MKSLLRIERVAVIRWSTLAFVAVLLFPLSFCVTGTRVRWCSRRW